MAEMIGRKEECRELERCIFEKISVYLPSVLDTCR